VTIHDGSALSYYVRKEDTAQHSIFCGDGTNVINVIFLADETLTTYDGASHVAVAGLLNTQWYEIAIKNIDWTAATYDLWLDGILVSDDASMWVSALYADTVTMSNVAGTSQAWVDNLDYFVACLPDETATGNTGVIYWGTNPSGVGTTLGGIVSVAQSDTTGISVSDSTSDILPTAGTSDWSPGTTVSAALLANPMRPIVIAVSDNTTLTEYQVWVWMGIIFVMFVTVLVGTNVRGHHTITGIAAGAAIVLMIVWTVFPLLVLPVVLLVIWGGHVSERSPSI
jgi:hypothetical protein